MSVALIKTLFVLLTEFYYNSQATSAHASCSPQELVIIPYVIGHKTYDITFTVIAMVIEVFIPLTAIAVFHWRVGSDTRRHAQQQTACVAIDVSLDNVPNAHCKVRLGVDCFRCCT